MNFNSKLIKNPMYKIRSFNDQKYLFSSTKAYKINQTAAFVWDELSKSPTYDKLYAALIEKYKGTDQKILHDDLESLINKYIKIGAVMALGD
ncbi:PqqD family protein [Lactobacillus iners]|mgnify:CR=1 FL=1|jgi:hypothetical protein|uniref:PqqD family protein n=1 Tax=Lactobacillus iners TaxID=147802 RepID=UPI0013E1714B|nr:PqqD family protein [Lactobacillus iners]MCT7702678.1 PqqD family protein [Lactobacillus iners]MCT7715461.1 PqqD family protein [Lactobacillus iners]MCT7716334.1 PqqD family protein [Lactobacillus iners]QIH25880.1 PqqD family protein [Lactobacillus iners]